MAKEHDNDVYFAITGVNSFSFTETGHSITSGEPYSGASGSVSDAGSKAKITVKAGRKGSSDVADWFKTQVGSGQTIVCDSKGNFPDKLNFAVQGTMTIGTDEGTYTCENVIVAQGHFGVNNNWWMGSPDWQGVHISLSGLAVQKVEFSGRDLLTLAVFAPQTPCVNNFDIGLVSLK